MIIKVYLIYIFVICIKRKKVTIDYIYHNIYEME